MWEPSQIKGLVSKLTHFEENTQHAFSRVPHCALTVIASWHIKLFFFYYLTVYLNAHQTLTMSAMASLIFIKQKWVCKRRNRKCKEERRNESKSWRGMFPDLRPVMAVTAMWEVIIAVERHSQQSRGVSENIEDEDIYIIKQQNSDFSSVISTSPCWNSPKCSPHNIAVSLK